MADQDSIDSETNSKTLNNFIDPLQKEWVKFDEDNNVDATKENSTHIKPSPTTEVEISQPKIKIESTSQPAVIEIPSNNISQLSTVELPRRRKEEEGLGNIKIIHKSFMHNKCIICISYLISQINLFTFLFS